MTVTKLLIILLGIIGLLTEEKLLAVILVALGGALWFAGRQLHRHLDNAVAERDAFWSDRP